MKTKLTIIFYRSQELKTDYERLNNFLPIFDEMPILENLKQTNVFFIVSYE